MPFQGHSASRCLCLELVPEDAFLPCTRHPDLSRGCLPSLRLKGSQIHRLYRRLFLGLLPIQDLNTSCTPDQGQTSGAVEGYSMLVVHLTLERCPCLAGDLADPLVVEHHSPILSQMGSQSARHPTQTPHCPFFLYCQDY